MNYDTIPDASRVEKTLAALAENGFDARALKSAADALTWVRETIPAGASVFTGTSQTLEKIGLIDLLKSGDHAWESMNAKVVAETDPVRQARLRKEATLADWYVGSVHALSEDGQLVIASASGSQLPAIVFNADNLILVASTKKIATDLADAIRRLEEHVVPLEDARMKSTGAPGTVLSKVLVYKKHPGWGRQIHVVLVNEDLGF